MMENNSSKVNIEPPMLIAIVVQIIYMIFMIISFSNVLAYEPVELGVGVAGISQQIEGLPDNGIRNIENYIYKAISSNSTIGSVGEMDVVIRDGSLINRYYDEFDFSYASFIVDIPKVQQSYQVSYEWSDDPLNEYVSPDNAAAIMCVSEGQMIYEDFGCKEVDKRQLIVGNMLSRYGYTLPGHDSMKLLVTPENWRDAGSRVKIEFLTCDGQCECTESTSEERRAIKNEFENFVNELGFQLDEIEYYFDNC